jgi:hypothetical protein
MEADHKVLEEQQIRRREVAENARKGDNDVP